MTTKETAKKIQRIRLAMVEFKNELREKCGLNIDSEMEDALQAMMAKEDEYHSTVETDWSEIGNLEN